MSPRHQPQDDPDERPDECIVRFADRTWHRGARGVLCRALEDGTCIMVIELAPLWVILDQRFRIFCPHGDKMPGFASEALAALAIEREPGRWLTGFDLLDVIAKRLIEPRRRRSQ